MELNNGKKLLRMKTDVKWERKIVKEFFKVVVEFEKEFIWDFKEKLNWVPDDLTQDQKCPNFKKSQKKFKIISAFFG